MSSYRTTPHSKLEITDVSCWDTKLQMTHKLLNQDWMSREIVVRDYEM